MADSPTAAAMVWTSEPVAMPKADSTPAPRPWLTLRAST